MVLKLSDRRAAPSTRVAGEIAVYSRAARLSQVALVSAATVVGIKGGFLISRLALKTELYLSNHHREMTTFVRHASARGPPGHIEERSVGPLSVALSMPWCHTVGRESIIESAIRKRGQPDSELSGMNCSSPALVRRLDFRTSKRFLR